MFVQCIIIYIFCIKPRVRINLVTLNIVCYKISMYIKCIIVYLYIKTARQNESCISINLVSLNRHKTSLFKEFVFPQRFYMKFCGEKPQ